jgi:hypothetical protein
MVSSGQGHQAIRARLGFRQEALAVFSFLTTDYDFRCIQADLHMLTYESEALFVLVYHDPLSYEVGVDLGKLGAGSKMKRSFPLVELMRLETPRRAEDLRYPAVVKPDQMRPALVNLAELLKAYGERVLGGDLSVLKQVRRERARLERELARASRLNQVRPRARAAFREEDYSRAASLHESMEDDLSPAESRMLEYSKKRSRRPGSLEG